MKITERKIAGALVVSLEGRLDGLTCRPMQRLLTEFAERGETCVILDCAGMSYISSAGLRVLLIAAKELKRNQGTLALSDLPLAVREVIHIAGFNLLFPIFKTSQQALESLMDVSTPAAPRYVSIPAAA